jgi:hypothetical protein
MVNNLNGSQWTMFKNFVKIPRCCHWIWQSVAKGYRLFRVVSLFAWCCFTVCKRLRWDPDGPGKVPEIVISDGRGPNGETQWVKAVSGRWFRGTQSAWWSCKVLQGDAEICFPPKSLTRVPQKSASNDCLSKVSKTTVPQECLTSVSQKSAVTRVSIIFVQRRLTRSHLRLFCKGLPKVCLHRVY